jgi:Protein of unknown function (DUF732)
MSLFRANVDVPFPDGGRSAQPNACYLTGSWAAQAPGRATVYGVPVQGVFVSIVVAAAASLAFAGLAGADTNDDTYLNLINSSGLGCGQGPFDCPTGDSDMIQIGRAICRQLTHGNSSLAVSQAIIRQKPGVQPEMVVRLVAVAKSAYCPT